MTFGNMMEWDTPVTFIFFFKSFKTTSYLICLFSIFFFFLSRGDFLRQGLSAAWLVWRLLCRWKVCTTTAGGSDLSFKLTTTLCSREMIEGKGGSQTALQLWGDGDASHHQMGVRSVVCWAGRGLIPLAHLGLPLQPALGRLESYRTADRALSLL